MFYRRLRLAAGLIMFSFLTLHLMMHSLGNLSWQTMEWGTGIHDFIWKSRAGTIALYGAFAIHCTLALWALYARDSLRMGTGEWARLLLGFTILPLLIHHYAAGRYAYTAYDAIRNYDVVLNAYFRLFPHWGWRQVVVLLIAWMHGCLGIHFWLRFRPWYERLAPALLAMAVLLPALALLGIWQGTREVLAYTHANPEWWKAVAQKGQLNPKVGAEIWNFETHLYWAYATLVGTAFAGRFIRLFVQRRRGQITIQFPEGRTVRVPKGWAVLDASRYAHIPHAAVCGGRGRCTTCRIRILRSDCTQPPPDLSEQSMLSRLGTGPSVRLACQLRPTGNLSVLPLLPANVRFDNSRSGRGHANESERTIAILFVDIRRSTALVEKRLPYDVVFLLNHFFEAVAGAVVDAGGKPNQFLGDGMMAIFGIDVPAQEACRQALEAAVLIEMRLARMNERLRHELPEPISIGIGIHAGNVILGELGYREHAHLTAIGDSVHVAARLQDLTKEYKVTLVVSDDVLKMADIPAGHLHRHEVQVRGRDTPLVIRAIEKLDDLDIARQTTGVEMPVE